MTNNRWEVSGASVVIVAQSHNPSIINPDFLKNNGIVGSEWNLGVAPPITTPIVAQIDYEYVNWQVVPEKCTISGKTAIDDNYIYKCAEKYVEVLEYIPYTAIGLNWRATRTLNSDASKWIKSRFLKSDVLESEMVSVELVFKLKIEDSICSLAVKTLNSQVQHNNLVVVECNFHFDVHNEEQRVKRMQDIVGKWLHYKNILDRCLGEYFIEEDIK